MSPGRSRTAQGNQATGAAGAAAAAADALAENTVGTTGVCRNRTGIGDSNGPAISAARSAATPEDDAAATAAATGETANTPRVNAVSIRAACFDGPVAGDIHGAAFTTSASRSAPAKGAPTVAAGAPRAAQTLGEDTLSLCTKSVNSGRGIDGHMTAIAPVPAITPLGIDAASVSPLPSVTSATLRKEAVSARPRGVDPTVAGKGHRPAVAAPAAVTTQPDKPACIATPTAISTCALCADAVGV
jgi:hypothetical protein